MNESAGRRARGDVADYVLVYRDQKLAVIEAKKRDAPDTAGLGQAKRYAKWPIIALDSTPIACDNPKPTLA